MKCSCIDVEIGSYDNQVTLQIPPHMREYEEARVKEGLSPYVCIDKCILPTILKVWEAGVKTTGCCCGHGKLHAYVGVSDNTDIVIMNSLGYTINDTTSFYPEKHFIIEEE